MVEKQRYMYACQAMPLLKITEYDKKKDTRERNRIGQERERRKATVVLMTHQRSHSNSTTLAGVRVNEQMIVLMYVKASESNLFFVCGKYLVRI